MCISAEDDDPGKEWRPLLVFYCQDIALIYLEIIRR